MGIVAKQSFFNLTFLLTGVLIGGISTIFIYPTVFENNLEEWGIIQTILAYALLGSQFLNLGIPNIAIKYFPKLYKKNQQGYLVYLLITIPTIALSFFGLFLILFQDTFLLLFKEETALMMKSHLLSLFLIMLVNTFYKGFHSFTTAKLKSNFPLFLSDVYIRIALLLGIGLYYFKYIIFTELLTFFAIAYASQTLLIVLYNYKSLKQIKTKQNSVSKKELTSYGLFAMLEGSTSTLTGKLDIVMVAAMLFADNVALYALGFFIGGMVALPQKAITAIAMPLVSKAWEENDIEEIQGLYSKTSINQTLIGGFIFVLIVLGLDDLFSLIGPKFEASKPIVILIGISKLADIIPGINGGIIVTSKHYRFNFIFNAFLLGITYISNLLLIPEYGINGAALATIISFAVFNLIKWAFVWKKMDLQPFNINTLKAILILGISFSAAHFSPFETGNAIVNIGVKTIIASIIFIPSVYLLNISPDINGFANKFLRRK